MDSRTNSIGNVSPNPNYICVGLKYSYFTQLLYKNCKQIYISVDFGGQTHWRATFTEVLMHGCPNTAV